MNKPLLHVLVTRPDPAGSLLCESLQAQGDSATHFPTIAFAAALDQVSYQQVLAGLGEQDYLIFLSPRAVYASVPDIRRKWPEFPNHLQFVAIGAGTTKALHDAGYIAIHPDEWSSEGLLAMPAFQAISGKKITIIRGEGGRNILADCFVDRGATVSELIAYRRVLPNKVNSNEFMNKIDVMICTSFESVCNAETLLGNIVRNIPLIVVSERIKMLAQDLGFQTIWIAKNASNSAILEMLVLKRDEIWKNKRMKSS